MRTLGNVQEHSIHKVEEELKFQVLTPRQTQIKEELAESLELNHVRLVVFLLILELGSTRVLFVILLSFNIDFPIFQSAILRAL